MDSMQYDSVTLTTCELQKHSAFPAALITSSSLAMYGQHQQISDIILTDRTSIIVIFFDNKITKTKAT